MEIEDRVPIEANFVGGADEKLDRIFVVEDHLRFEVRPALRFLAELDEALGIEERVCVAFEAARIPGEVDEEPIQDVLGVGAGGLPGDLRSSHSRQVGAVLLGQVE
jgi:hypothetical protein